MRDARDAGPHRDVCLGCGRACDGACSRPLRRIAWRDGLFSLAIAHVDCDAFYAAIEKRDDPSLAEKPVIVGGGRRGVVATACYVARRFGVRSAMPMFKALRACPNAVVIRPRFEAYAAAGREIREMMTALTPLVEPLSIDEAFLDLAGAERVHGGPPAVLLARLQAEVAREVGVTISVGLSDNKFLAKLASDLEKPNGFTVLPEAEAPARLAPMPVTKIWGVGAATARRLAEDGARTIGDLQRMERSALEMRYGKLGARLADLSVGRDARAVRPDRAAKSVSAETTFNDDVASVDELESRLWALCERVAGRMREKSLEGRVVTLKLKDADFAVRTRRASLAAPSALARTLFETARGQLASLLADAPGRRYRLVGVGYSDLTDAGAVSQGELFDTPREDWRRREAAIEAVRQRFGDGAIVAGRSLDVGAAPRSRSAGGSAHVSPSDRRRS
ncbi:MAG: DNA polymerase IV [Parvularculaceae bacterium]